MHLLREAGTGPREHRPPIGYELRYEGAIEVDYTRLPQGTITALDGDTGRILWKHQTDAQVMAGLVPTKGGLVFGGDVRGNLFAFDATTGSVLTRIDAGGALNNGLVSYAVDGTQYVAAAVGGITLLTRGVSHDPFAARMHVTTGGQVGGPGCRRP